MKFIVADSQKVICDSVQLIASTIEDWTMVGQTTSAAATLDLLRNTDGPLTVVAGARLSDGYATDLMAACAKAGIAADFIILTNANELGFAREALKAGAGALCLVDDIHEKLPQILQSHAEGVVSMPARLLQKLLTDGADRLTKREHEIMVLLSEGLTNFQISARLGLSQNTVKYYLKAIYQKLDVSTRGAAIAKFVAGDF